MVDVHLSWLNCFDFLLHEGDLLVLMIDCLNFMLTFLDVSSLFPGTARLWSSLPIEYFPLTNDLNGFKSRISRHLLIVGSFKTEQISYML